MKKKQSQTQSDQDQLDEFPNFSDIQSRVFAHNGKGDIYLGKEFVPESLRGVLRDDAKMFQNSRLWEILNASVINEAYSLALNQSQDFNAVLYAKALYEWSKFVLNVITILSKE